MIVNLDKFHAIILNKKDNNQKFIICNKERETSNLVNLLRVKIGNRLKSNENMSTLIMLQCRATKQDVVRAS